MRSSPKTNIAVITLGSTVLLTPLVTLAPRLSPALNHVERTITGTVSASPADAEKKCVKWIDFDITNETMKQTFRCDVSAVQSDTHLDWISLPAYLSTRYGGDFSKYSSENTAAITDRLLTGESMDGITADMKYYSYYLEAYTAVLGGLVGTYQMEVPATKAPAQVLEQAAGESPDTSTSVNDDCVRVTKYGLKGFSPIAKNYPYNDFDDFGVTRSYGFKRQRLGYGIMGQMGAPVIVMESGYVEAIGWSQYGDWRLGIRSFDGKCYYCYTHLQGNYPYHKTLQEDSVIQTGGIIGYLGRAEYSRTEDTDNIDEPHLRFGLQLIFDESQREDNNEIWVNCYELTKFLTINRSETIKGQETKEYHRVYQMKDPAVPDGAMEQRYQ